MVPPWCEHCGRPLLGDDCPHCRRWPLSIDGLRAVAYFEGVLRQAIHAFKYRHRPELALVFGRMLNDYLFANPLPVDALIPIPLAPEREHQRGYNQSFLLANELAVVQNLPLWYNVVGRTRATRPQVELGAAERRENMRDAFAARDRVSGARLLLIDDICTTGATMDACAIALKAQGAASVWGLTLARGR
jgi:ComF family protein